MSIIQSLRQAITKIFFSKDAGRDKLILSLVLLIIIVSIGLIFFFSPEVEIDSDSLRITGLYGIEIPYEKISNIELKEEIPKITRKINGIDSYGYSVVLIGRFMLEDLGEGKLFIKDRDGPFIVIHYDNTFAIINYKDSDKTRTEYQELLQKLN